MKEKIKKAWKRARDKGFSLIELIVCVTLLGVLMALLIPAYINKIDVGREQSAIAQCNSCVSVAMMKSAIDESFATIEEDDVPLAALPRTAEPEEETVPGSDKPQLWEEIEAEANAEGEILELQADKGRLSRLVYVTKNGMYTVTYDGNDYSAEKND